MARKTGEILQGMLSKWPKRSVSIVTSPTQTLPLLLKTNNPLLLVTPSTPKLMLPAAAPYNPLFLHPFITPPYPKFFSTPSFFIPPPPYLCVVCAYLNKPMIDWGSKKRMETHHQEPYYRRNSERGGDNYLRYHFPGNCCGSCGNGFKDKHLQEMHESYCLRRWYDNC
ncbi:uncharacterized protein LOC132267664 [Cornus florida]|uniref:uncharacterized protein LOC132267664 n=1 Tax=Cornus florida TaxID=4283 RepID=UPI0028995BAF|nr:uncharacterized protein LOC132267664 [Cornus florida]